MVYVAAIIRWDKKMGPQLEIQYPEMISLTDEFITKIYMTHTIEPNHDHTEEVLELSSEKQVTISYCQAPTHDPNEYEIFLFVLNKTSEYQKLFLKQELKRIAKKVLDKPPGKLRNEAFKESMEAFFEERSKRKIVFLGRPETGKTSIKKVVFEGADPGQLIKKSLKPTRGTSTAIYSWLDLELGLFDTAGQQLTSVFENEKKQARIFSGADIVVYLIDRKYLEEQKDVIFSDISSLIELEKEQDYNSRVVLFFHKIDLLPEESRETKIESIKAELTEKFGLEIFFTSIHPEYIFILYSAIYQLLAGFSEDTVRIREILEKKTSEQNKSMILVTNSNNNIIAQSVSADFNFGIINYIHHLILTINQIFDQMRANDKIEHFMLKTFENFNIVMKTFDKGEKYNLRNLICISGDLGPNKLIFLMGDIFREINKYFYMKYV